MPSSWPRVLRSRRYIFAFTGSVLGIVAGVLVEVSVALAIIGLWSVDQYFTGRRAVKDAENGQYYDKKEGELKKL